MENKTNKNVENTKRKILSLIFLIIFSLTFIFACLRKVLPLGHLITCTFGLMTYPLFLILSLVELAKVLGLKYKRNKKSTAYILIAIISLLFVIQAISTYKQLDKVVSFGSFKEYLNYSYDEHITFVGSFGSIFVGALSILLGAMGTIVAFVISLTISVGVLVDYENYGKFDDEKIKKLKTKSIREKVFKSDKDKLSNGKPAYQFSSENDIIDTIEVNENEINYAEKNQNSTPYYSEKDIFGEISDDSYLDTLNDENIQESPFSNIHNQTDESLTQARRDFIGGTFGNYQTSNFQTTIDSAEQSETSDYLEQITNNSKSDSSYEYLNELENLAEIKRTNDLWGDDSSKNDIQIDDALKNILTQDEDELDNLTPDSNTSDFSNIQDIFNVDLPQTSESVYNETPLAFNDSVINSTKTHQTNHFDNSAIIEQDIKKRNGGILSNEPVQPKIEQPKPVVPNGNPIAMRGIRYNPPPLSLLAKPVQDNGNYEEEQTRKSKQLEEVLSSFNIPAKVVNIVRGPKITRYELSVPLGVSVKKIPNYEADIQRSLAAKTVNIQAPIPGSSYVGIELENDTFTSVFERELFESPEFQNAKGPLPIAIGKDISGAIIVKSLAKMVHCLVAGSTGSGKSVFIHNIVLSLIYKYSPEDLRLVMVDPKRVEFGFYNGLPHLIAPEVVLGTEKAVNALKWCVQEMDRRFDIMGRVNYKNIEDYNKSELVKSGQLEHFPYIVIIVDELAEIMTIYKKDAEPAIQRITQLARACGMHLIVAVQRPSVDIITGVIKNNISSRFAFRLQSGFDSKTMLGTNGAEKLLGQGDMIMSLTDSAAMPRLQAAYASDDEIKSVVEFITMNNSSMFYESAEKAFNATPQSADDVGNRDFSYSDPPQSKGSVDEYFKVAVKYVMMNGSASVSYLQRKLSIGYCRSAKIIDQMEEKGYIAPPTGAKTRKVLITPEQFKEDFGEDYNS